MPLSLHSQNRLNNIPLVGQEKNGTGKFGFSYETPHKQSPRYDIPKMDGRAFDKKPSYLEEEAENICKTPTSKTPSKKKTYKYYFD